MKISRKYKISDWQRLSLSNADDVTTDWNTAVSILKDRVESRFLEPATKLIDLQRSDKNASFGFAILALDCLVIETISGFRNGITDHSGKSLELFTVFLEDWQPFQTCADFGPGGDKQALNKKARNVYRALRCALHHSGSTDRLTVNRTGDLISFEDDQPKHINRNKFHDEVRKEFERYAQELLKDGSKVLRENLKTKMNAICGL